MLEYLAVEDPLSLAELSALAGRDAVTDAEAAGAVVVDGDRVRPAHPLFVDAVRDALGGPELRRLRTELVDRLAAAPPSRRRRPAAARGAGAGQRQPAAGCRRGRRRRRRRCGSATWNSANGSARPRCDARRDLHARLTLAYALAWQGRGREADAVLADVDPSTLSETELMAWALPRAANQFWMLSEPERATAFLQTTRDRASRRRPRRRPLDALSATFAMNAGSPGRAMQIAEEVLASPDGRRHRGRLGGGGRGAELARGWAGSPTSTRWPNGRSPRSIPGCCASPVASARRRRC